MKRKMFSFLLFGSREKGKNSIFSFLLFHCLLGEKSRKKENVLVKDVNILPTEIYFSKKQYLSSIILFSVSFPFGVRIFLLCSLASYLPLP